MFEIISVISLIVFASIMSYAYIRLSIAKENENKLLKNKINADSKSVNDELNSYRTAVKAIESYVNKEAGKRVGLQSDNDVVLGILSRCGFTVATINDVEEHKDKKELVFRLSGKDLVSVMNREINTKDKLTNG